MDESSRSSTAPVTLRERVLVVAGWVIATVGLAGLTTADGAFDRFFGSAMVLNGCLVLLPPVVAIAVRRERG